MECSPNFPDDPIQPVLASVQGGDNVLEQFYRHTQYGGKELSHWSSARRAEILLRELRASGMTAERIVADIRNALDQRALTVRGCSAAHERKVGIPLCYPMGPLMVNLNCLHGGDAALDAACDLLQGWALLPPDVADMHRESLIAARRVARGDADRSLDDIARNLWRDHQRRPSDVSFWKGRFDEIGHFRNLIREALLRVEPRPNFWRRFLYRRDAHALAKRRPRPITYDEMRLGFQQAGLPVGSYSR